MTDAIELDPIHAGVLPVNGQEVVAIVLDGNIYPQLVDEWPLEAGTPLATMNGIAGLDGRRYASEVTVHAGEFGFSFSLRTGTPALRHKAITDRKLAITIAQAVDPDEGPVWLIATFDIDTTDWPDLAVNDPDQT